MRLLQSKASLLRADHPPHVQLLQAEKVLSLAKAAGVPIAKQ